MLLYYRRLQYPENSCKRNTHTEQKYHFLLWRLDITEPSRQIIVSIELCYCWIGAGEVLTEINTENLIIQ
jgi:hypothetical protein